MASPSHYIRTIHSSFAAHSASSWSSHNALFDLGGLMNQYPPGLGYGPQEVPYRAVGRRRPSHSAPFESPRRHAIHSPKPTHTPFASQSSYNKFDPFADENSLELVRPISSPSSQTTYPSFQRRKSSPLPAPSASQVTPHSAPFNPWPPSTSSSANGVGIVNAAAPPSPLGNRDARAKLVAGILLNRVHAVGRPMRRRSFADEPREYVRSRLSSVVTADV